MNIHMNILDYRKIITKKLSLISDSPQLDSELLFMHALNKSRAELLMRSNELLSEENITAIDDLIKRRLKGEPIAYLLGTQPFWTMDLIVSHDTLIPRPETECLVEWILHHFAKEDSLQIADLGTGTGAIAIALGLEKKNWHIDATDQSQEALAIAKKNIVKYGAKNVSLYRSDWCQGLPKNNYDIIVSNPPYIAHQDPHLSALQFEPQTALVSGADGLNDIRKIAMSAKNYLAKQGTLVIEHGFDQADAVVAIFKNAGFQEIKNHRDLADIPRFVTGIL